MLQTTKPRKKRPKAEPTEPRKLLTIEQAATLLGIHAATLYRWARQNKVPCIRMGRRVIRFDPPSLEHFLAGKTVEVK
jgi:excisionase family DNA binding protein